MHLRQQLYMQVDRLVWLDVLLSYPVRPRTVLLFSDDACVWHVPLVLASDTASTNAPNCPVIHALPAIRIKDLALILRHSRLQQTRCYLDE